MGKVPHDVEVPAIAAEVDTLRERTQAIVGELEQRLRTRVERSRHALERMRHVVDIRAQLREHPALLFSVGVALLGIGVAVVVWRVRTARRPLPRLRARLAAYRALVGNPERVMQPSLGKRLLGAILIAAATTVTRAVSGLVVKRTLETPQVPA
jgi:hypothetical protein